MPLSSPSYNPIQNKILATLPHEEYERLLQNLESVHLPQNKILSEAGDVVKHAYFLLNGVVSLLSTTEDGETIEAAMVGSEGMIGIPVILRTGITPYQTVTQIAADSMRIKADTLRNEFNRGVHLQDLLLRYTHSLLVQVSQSATCNHFHKVEKRLCRWLLSMRDRVQADSFHLTQEFISYMLGAPRSSVTVAALSLQDAGIIQYRRGKLTILNQRRLESNSCECYQTMKNETGEIVNAEVSTHIRTRHIG